MYTMMSSAKNESLLPPFQFGCLFFFLSDHCATTSSTMLIKSSENRHPGLVHDLKGKAFSFCPLNMVLTVGFSYMALLL